MSETLNKEAKEIVSKISKAAEKFGKVWDYDAVVIAMNKHYTALGISIPKIVAIDNMEEAYKKCRDAARDAAWGAAWGAARDAAWGAGAVNTGLRDEATLKFISIEAPLLEALEAGLGFFFPMRDILILVPTPKFSFNPLTQLHNDKIKAVEWRDGSGYYFLNGVKFPEKLWEQVVSGKMPFEKILAIEDIDQRTQAMKYGDVRQFLKHTNAELIDRHVKKTLDGVEVNHELFKIPKGEVFTTDAYYMIYDCPSTRKVYMSGVTKEVATSVPEAMAWKQSISVEDWLNMIPLVHES